MEPSEKVAAVEDLPFVMELGQDRGGRPVQGRGVGEYLDDVGPRLDLPVQPLQRLVDQILFQWAGGKSANAVMSVAASNSMARPGAQLRVQRRGAPVPPDFLPVGALPVTLQSNVAPTRGPPMAMAKLCAAPASPAKA